MKVKLLEHYQDAAHIFTPGQEVETDEVLGAWLVKHGKAVSLEAAPKKAESLKVAEDVSEVPDVFVDPEPEEKPKRRGKK